MISNQENRVCKCEKPYPCYDLRKKYSFRCGTCGLPIPPKAAEEVGWSKDCGVYHCSDGDHNSFWKSIVATDEWEAWYKHASENNLYDVDECQECGWMSEGHAKDFLAFVVAKERKRLREAVAGMKKVSPQLHYHGSEKDYWLGMNHALAEVEKIIG